MPFFQRFVIAAAAMTLLIIMLLVLLYRVVYYIEPAREALRKEKKRSQVRISVPYTSHNIVYHVVTMPEGCFGYGGRGSFGFIVYDS